MQQKQRGNTAGQLRCRFATALRRIADRRRNATGQPEWGVLPQLDMRARLDQPKNAKPRDKGGAEFDRAGRVFHRSVTSATLDFES